jgi:hypothetical protein
VIGFQSVPHSPPGFSVSDVYILGAPFLRSFSLSLDYATSTISLAQSTHFNHHTNITDAKISLDDKIKDEDDDLIERIETLEKEVFEIEEVVDDLFELGKAAF